MTAHWRKVRVWTGDYFSVAELQRFLFYGFFYVPRQEETCFLLLLGIAKDFFSCYVLPRYEEWLSIRDPL